MNENEGFAEKEIEIENEHEAKLVSLTGATRIAVKEMFHHICPELERRVSLICAEGYKSYPDKDIPYAELSTGRKGLPLANLLKHARRHFNLYLGGDKTEDHLAKIAWTIMQIMHQQKEPPCQHFNILLKEEDRISADAQKPEGF